MVFKVLGKNYTEMIVLNGLSACCKQFSTQFILLNIYVSLRLVTATQCPTPTGVALKSTGQQKTCPGFKDAKNRNYCCPSHVDPGSFFCCTEEQFYEFESEENAQLRRQFVKNNLALIIIGTLCAIVIVFILTMCLCKHLSYCPLYGRRTVSAYPGLQSSRQYRPVDVMPNKPADNEAPPPYDYSFGNQQRRNDWLYLLENDVNDTRQGNLLT